MTEPAEIRLKRLHMRSIRRGIKEMDLILTAYAEARLPRLDPGEVDLYEALLEENDHDILAWVVGQTAPPAHLAALIADLRRTAENVLHPRTT